MKIGLTFTGISYDPSRDYQHCFPNITQQLITPLKKEHDVKIYLMSYKSEYQEHIIDLFQPALYQFNDFENSHQILTYIKAMEQLRNQDLDLVISTRFDIHFHKDISQIGLNYDKFNVLFKERGWWKNMKFTTDNLFVFPYSMLEDFISALQYLYANPSRPGQMDMHQVFYRVQQRVGQARTNIVSNIDELSNTNIFYSLCNAKWGIK